MDIRLIVGLGNPGADYDKTRHNAGFWLLDGLARQAGGVFRRELKFQGDVCQINLDARPLWLLKPQTFMNRSGAAVASLARFYKLLPESILVVHDELDLPPGAVRLKRGGGHGGHNGLRDIVQQLGSRDFLRLRLGIGHPGDSRAVINYVLHPAAKAEQALIEQAIDDALRQLPAIVGGRIDAAMNALHQKRSTANNDRSS